MGRNIRDAVKKCRKEAVALLAEGVGRNDSENDVEVLAGVALLAEGVGRNQMGPVLRVGVDAVALLAEGVGRNTDRCPQAGLAQSSPSSRRAWVEIG